MLTPGTRIGPYEVVGSLGQGGMGEVYRARDLRLQRQVAIKTMTAHVAADPRFHERFAREARAVAALSHPNVLAIHDVGSHEGIAYVVVEYLEGETLRSKIGASPLPLSKVLDYAVQIGRGMAAAHDRGIVHRDLKPENIFVTRDEQVKLLDFGLATEPAHAGEESTLLPATDYGVVLGTAGYMSPEQARGEVADARSDVFSFGCVLYEMLSGRRAFTGDSRIETLHAVLKEHPPDLSSVRDVPLALDRVVRRCLEKAPASRFQSARDLVFTLETLGNQSADATPVGLRSSSPRRSKRPLMAALAAGALVAAGGFWWTARRQPSPPAQSAVAHPSADRRLLVAVLPFEHVSQGDAGYFAAGMTDEVTNQLSKLSDLRVIARAAVAQFKEPRQQLARMAQELGIGSVVTGAVREDGSRVRVNVELIDAASGQLIWSEQYDREGVDVFAAQSDIALKVAGALDASVTLEERARVGKRPTTSVAAYELYIRARGPQAGRTSEERLASRVELLHKAVALDPHFAEAYGELANVHYFQGAYGELSALSRGIEAANQAISIDPQLGAGYRGLALNLSQLGRLREALPAFRKAVALTPNEDNLADLSHGEITAGRFDLALDAAKRASKLTGGHPGNYHVGVALLFLNDDARTERYLLQGLAQPQVGMRLPILLAFLDLRRGHTQPAVDRIRAAVAQAPENIEVLITRAEVLTFAGTPDAADVVRALVTRSADGLLHDAPYPVKLLHAYHLLRAGSTSEALRILDNIAAANRAALVAGADWPMVFMQNAAVHALRGETTPALDELERAYAAGWRDGRTLAIDPLLASVRTQPRFSQLLARIDTDVARMRAQADYSGLP